MKMTAPRLAALVLVTTSLGVAASVRAEQPAELQRRGARDDGRAVVSFVGFEQGKQGASSIRVDIERPVTVTQSAEGNRLTFRMAQAKIPTRNNLHPLLTTHFDTVVASARLVRAGDDVALVVELREKATVRHSMTDSGGAGVLVVDFPPRSVRPSKKP